MALIATAQIQSEAKLSGTITDPRGAVIPGAQIAAEMISSSGAGETIHGVSSGEGTFCLTLAPGRYRITISRDSFTKSEEEISIAAGETREEQFHMALEPLSSQVVVTAQTLPIEAESSPTPATILTREQIEQRAATSLPNLLATQPGLSMGRTGAEGGTAALFLDGGNSNYTKVLVDGAPINTPGGLVDFSNFTLANVDKIEIVHGAESVLYGSDAMDGVIQIFTRRGTTRVPEFTAYADGGNFSSGHGGADLSGLLGRFDYSAGVADLETAGQGPNDAFRDRTLSGNFGWRFSDTAHTSLSLRDNVSDAGTPGQTLLGPADLTDSIALHNFSANLLSEFMTDSHWHHQLDATEFYFRELNNSSFGPTLYQYNVSRVAGQSTYLVKTFSITAGYEYDVENGFISYIGYHARRNNQAGFLDAQWQPLARLTL
ncbi:MAG: TonB-dependent receptor plug domain-containing protein, partial [Candidatus Acidiferrales bacterium]